MAGYVVQIICPAQNGVMGYPHLNLTAIGPELIGEEPSASTWRAWVVADCSYGFADAQDLPEPGASAGVLGMLLLVVLVWWRRWSN